MILCLDEFRPRRDHLRRRDGARGNATTQWLSVDSHCYTNAGLGSFSMASEDKLVAATLAAAIVIARGATAVSDIEAAWRDASWIANPVPGNGQYEAWKASHQKPITTPEQDAARMAAFGQSVRRGR